MRGEDSAEDEIGQASLTTLWTFDELVAAGLTAFSEPNDDIVGRVLLLRLRSNGTDSSL